MPFAVYTDPSLQVYDALGMTKYPMSFSNTLSGNGFGPRGEYVRHGTVFGLGIVMAKAVKVNMPIWRGPGSAEQLGGEFILGPGCVFIFVCYQPSEFQRQNELFFRAQDAVPACPYVYFEGDREGWT
jgi:hypothetical protein